MSVSDQSAKAPDITHILQAWSAGQTEAANALAPLVYDELRRQARCVLRRERSNHTLQPTALVNEAYLKLIGQRRIEWQSRTHFFAIAASLMRQILVDYARSKNRKKRGGGSGSSSGVAANIPLEDTTIVAADGFDIDLLALDEALDKLFGLDEQQARIVELRYFSGLSIDETAAALQISEATVNRDWRMAKAWLRRELTRAF